MTNPNLEVYKISSTKDKTGKVKFTGKVIAPEKKGFGSKKYSAEEKKKIKEETLKHVRSGEDARKKRLGLDLNDDDVRGLSEGQQLLLSRLNKMAENKSFEKIKDKDRLKKVLSFIPDLDEYPLIVLKAIIDNKKINFSKISRENEDLLLELIAKIMEIPNLRAIFNKKDLLYTYQIPGDEVETFFQGMNTGLKDFHEKTEQLDDRIAEKLYDLAGASAADPQKFKELKQIVPTLQKSYNDAKGHRNPNQTIVKLGKDKISEVAPFVFSFKERRDRTKRLLELNERVKADLDAKDEEYQQLQAEYEKESAILETIDREYKELGERIKSIRNLTMENLESFLGQLVDEKNKINDPSLGARTFPILNEGDVDALIEKVAGFIAERKELVEFGQLTTSEINKLTGQMNHLSTYMDARYNELENYKREYDMINKEDQVPGEEVGPTPKTPKTPKPKAGVTSVYDTIDLSSIDNGTLLDDSTFISAPASPTVATGSGLTKDPKAPYGRLKNGKPRKHKKKDPNVYHPRNKLHWLQAKDDRGKFVGGSLIGYAEIEQKLLNLKNNNFQQKALDMLNSIQDVLTHKEYKDIFHKLIN